ncbi:terminase large subunit [Methylobacterium oryzihabitans]|uniref:Terminase large subunit n=1 Tax=Methylobacterium oryzihabitans TaxID=2499852 RepID=A0A3S2V9S2_9HYPH|nr:terminase TerL endonuclease subunit [Methylobacterium oryzihabitans]RVU17487.1 terminase large subunit [Methylobacterium oryzihabitans]
MRSSTEARWLRARVPAEADPVTAWAQAVVAGEVVAGPHVRNACRRHLHDLEDGPGRGLTWDLAAARRAIEFCPVVCRLNGGQFEGRPFTLQPSQAFKTGSLFGWKRADGTRRFRRAYIEEGKGNGKSPWAAATGLYGMVADGEARAEIYAAASKKDQAFVLFRDAVAMVDLSPALARRLVKSGKQPVWNLADPRSHSFFRPISSEDGQSGPRPSFALCDEVHEHRDGRVLEMLERGFKFRRQPLLVMITNAGTDRNSVCWGEHQHAVRVAAGTRDPDHAFTYVGEVLDDTTFSFVCALDPDDDPLTDPGCWAKANPLLGVTITRDYLAGVVDQARQIPGKLNGILRLHFCVWTDAETAWMGRQALEAVLAEFDPVAEHGGKDAHGGLDLAAVQDLTAAAFVVETGRVAVAREDGSVALMPTFDAWVEAWTPGDTLSARALRDKAPYETWVRDGWLQAPPGKLIRNDFVVARLAALNATFRLRQIAYDRHTFRRFEEDCASFGLDLAFVEHPQGGKRRARPTEEQVEAARRAGVEAPQGLWMPGSIRALETLILERRIRIRRSPVLISAAMSAVLSHDPFDNAWFEKRKATNRIDAIVALAMAVGAAVDAPPPVETSISVGFVDLWEEDA